MPREIAPGVIKVNGRLNFAGYRRVKVTHIKVKSIPCDGCGKDIPPGKFIVAFRDRDRFGFHNMDCMRAHYDRIMPPQKRAREAWKRRNEAKRETEGKGGIERVHFSADVKRLDFDDRKDSTHKRKRAIAIGEKFSRQEIFDRDNGICHICKLPVDFSKRGNYPTAPTTDHIIAIDNGGPHVAANVATAHHHCNAVKAAREWLYVHEIAACQAKVSYHARQSA